MADLSLVMAVEAITPTGTANALPTGPGPWRQGLRYKGGGGTPGLQGRRAEWKWRVGEEQLKGADPSVLLGFSLAAAQGLC